MARNKGLSRRHFLRGAGVCITLPMLESIVPRALRAQTDATQRLLVIYHPNGTTNREYHEPFVPPELLERFQEFSGRMSVVRNMNNQPLKLRQLDGFGTAHCACFTPMFGGAPVSAPGEEHRTFDQHIALDERHQGQTVSSIAINCARREGSQSGVPEQHFNTLSWEGPGRPVTLYSEPRRLFERLFSDASADGNPELRARLERRQLYLDGVLEQIRDVRRRVNPTDARRLDEYLTGVEELDRDTRALLEGQQAACEAGDAPEEILGSRVTVRPDDFPVVLDLMQDLSVRAFQCDLTRVITFMHAGVPNGTVLRQSFVSGFEGTVQGWHPLSHWKSPYGDLSSDRELNLRDFRRVVTWHYDRAVSFVRKLDRTPGPSGGSLLDETLVTFGSSMSYGVHSPTGLYQFLIGGSGHIRHGLDIDADRRPTADLFLTVMRSFGLETGSLGQSTEIFPELLG